MIEYWYTTQKSKLWSRKTKPLFWGEEANLEINDSNAKEENKGKLEFSKRFSLSKSYL